MLLGVAHALHQVGGTGAVGSGLLLLPAQALLQRLPLLLGLGVGAELGLGLGCSRLVPWYLSTLLPYHLNILLPHSLTTLLSRARSVALALSSSLTWVRVRVGA